MNRQTHIEPEKFDNERKISNTETRSGIKGDSLAPAKPTKKKDKDNDGLSDSDEDGGGTFERMQQMLREQMATIEKLRNERKQYKQSSRQTKLMENYKKDKEKNKLEKQYKDDGTLFAQKLKEVEDIKERDEDTNEPNKLPLTKQGPIKISNDTDVRNDPEESNLYKSEPKLGIAKREEPIDNYSENTPNDKENSGKDINGKPVLDSHIVSTNIFNDLNEGGIVNEMVENISTVTIDSYIRSLLKSRSDRTIINYKGITSAYEPQAIFKWIDGKIPTLFSFQSFHNPRLASNEERVIENYNFGGVLTDQMRNSIEMVKDGTYAVTLVFDPKNYDINFSSSDINYYKQVVVTGSQYDSNTTVIELSNRLNRIAKLVNSAFILIRNITKLKIEETLTNNSIYANLQTLLEGDNPHPYFGSRYHKCPWFTKELERVSSIAPISIAEIGATSDNSHKISSQYSCITDQFTSHFQRNAFNIIESNLIRTEIYVKRLNANTYKNSEIVDRESRDPPLRKFFEPPQHAWNILMYRNLIDPDYSNYIMKSLIKEVIETKTFDIAEPVGFIKLLNVTTTTGDPSIRKIFTTFPLITAEQFAMLFVQEHFSWRYRVIFESDTDLTIDSTIPEIFSILATKIFFPKLFQRGANSIMYRLMLCLELLDPEGMSNLRDALGYIISLDSNGKLSEIHIADVITPISYDQSVQGWIFSLACPVENFKYKGMSNIIKVINKIINTPLDPVLLNRKRLAGYPFMYNSYSGYASYGNLGTANTDERFRNRYEAVFKELIDAIRRCYGGQKKNSGDSQMNWLTRRVFRQYVTNLQTLVNTIGPVFYSLSQLSDLLMNSWAYSFEGYESRHPALILNEFGITVEDQTAFAGIGRLDLEYLRLSAHVGGSLYVGLRGGRYRPSVETSLRAQAEYREFVTQSNIIPFNSIGWTKASYALATDSYKFGIAMGVFLRFVSIARGDNVGPEYEFLKRYAKFFQMRTFAELADDISNIFHVNLRSVYGSTFIEGNLRDLRSSKLVVTFVDRDTDAAIDTPSSKFNTEIIWIDDIVEDTITTAVQLLLLDESPAHFIGKGLIIQRLRAQNLSPRMEIPAPRLILDYYIGMFKYTTEGETKGVSMIYTDENGREVRIIDPLDPRLDGIRIRFTDIGTLNVYWKNFILSSIKEGRLSIEIENIDYRYKIAYWDTNSIDIPDQFEIITRIINSQGGEYVNAVFMDTTYAKRTEVYTIGTHVYETFLFPIEKFINTGEVITGIYDPVQEPSEFTIDSGDQLGYSSVKAGQERGVDYLPVSGIPKLYGPRPNMNNVLNVYTNIPQFDGDLDMFVKPPGDL